MYSEEEISHKFDSILRSNTVIKRRVKCNPYLSRVAFGFPLPLEEQMEERRQYGRTIMETHQLIRRIMDEEILEEMLIQPLANQIETKIARSKTLFTLCANPSILHHTLLSQLYESLDDRLEECDEEIENIAVTKNASVAPKRFELTMLVCEFIQFLNVVKENLTTFYRENPFRTLELSEYLSKKILTVDVCLSPSFLPYIIGEMNPPTWMVPRTVRTLNDARMIYQKREFVKEERMKLFVTIAKSSKLPLVLLKMIAEYAIDLSKLKFDLFDVITEEMLRHNQYNHLVYARALDITSQTPSIVIIV
uniref:Uncharacterized protein n=1 Tax=viral metagenome TaxID=1070528 RepID=A0A6C0HSZ3_9ZZZZ